MLSWKNESAVDPCLQIQAERDAALDKIKRVSDLLATEDAMTNRTVRKLKVMINNAQAILAE